MTPIWATYFCTARVLVSMHRIAEELSRVKELLRAHPHGLSITDIAAKLGRNKHSVGRYLDILHASGHVDLRTFGMAKVFTLSSRVPLSALLSYSTDLVMVVDQNLRIIQVNEPFLSLTGLVQDQVIFQEMRYLPSPDPSVLALLSMISEQIRISQDLDEVALDSDPKRYFHLRIVPTVFDDGTAGTTVILEDITSVREAREEIRKSREFFRDMIANMTDGLVVVEEDRFLFINDRMVEITGYSKEEIASMDLARLATKEEETRLVHKMKAMEDNLASIQEIRFWAVRKSGESCYLYVRMSANRYGDRLRYYVLITDMTEWRRGEEERELQWNLMRNVVDQFPHPLFCYRDDGVLFLGNGEFCRFFGCDNSDISGKNLQDLMGKEIYASFTSSDRDLCARKGHEMKTLPLSRAGQSPVLYPVKKSTVSVGESSSVYIFCVILTDCADQTVSCCREQG